MVEKFVHYEITAIERRKDNPEYFPNGGGGSSAPACRNGSAHYRGTRFVQDVTCPACLTNHHFEHAQIVAKRKKELAENGR